jgi:hypothetical protein
MEHGVMEHGVMFRCLTPWESAVLQRRRYRWVSRWGHLFLLLVTIALPSRAADNDAVLVQLHERLINAKKSGDARPVIIVGELSRLGPVSHGICKEAALQDVEFTVSSRLLGSDSRSVLRTGYENCTGQPLPSPPFTLHAKVIVYCGYAGAPICLDPVEFREDRLAQVNRWIAEFRRHQASLNSRSSNHFRRRTTD